jgi:F-type H+-transporting ATPase subunit epsilon
MALLVAVISPEKTVYEGTADQVVAPAWDGEIGILTGHSPTLVLLGTGPVRISNAGAQQTYNISGGFMQVVEDRVTILSERAEPT